MPTRAYSTGPARAVHSSRAPAKKLMKAIAVMNETRANSDHLAVLRQTRSKLQPISSRRRRWARSPSIQPSSGRIHASRKTVWGQAYPHQSRP